MATVIIVYPKTWVRENAQSRNRWVPLSVSDCLSKITQFDFFDARTGTRDGLEFTAAIDRIERPGFISGTALAVIRGDAVGSFADVFNAQIGRIAIAVSRKVVRLPDGAEVTLCSDVFGREGDRKRIPD